MAALTFEATKRIVDTKDYRVQVNEAGNGYPLILIHGAGAGATGWSSFSPNIPFLAARYRCIAVTLPGWGESSPQSVATGRDSVEAILQLVDALGIERAAFAGNSMGGGVALRFTAVHPERVSHLITTGSGIPGIGIFQAGRSEGSRVIAEVYEDPTPENFMRMIKVMCYEQSFAGEEIAAERSRAALQYPDHNKNWIEYSRSGQVAGPPDLLSRLETSKVPALLIHGREDRTAHFEASLRTTAVIPNSRMVLFSHCGHWPQIEHAAEFNRLTDDFIANN